MLYEVITVGGVLFTAVMLQWLGTWRSVGVVAVALAASLKGRAGVSPLLAGTGKDDVHLLVVVTSDRNNFV